MLYELMIEFPILQDWCFFALHFNQIILILPCKMTKNQCLVCEFSGLKS